MQTKPQSCKQEP